MVQDWSPGEQASTRIVIDILMKRRRGGLLTTNNSSDNNQDYGLGIVQQCGQSGQNMDLNRR